MPTKRRARSRGPRHELTQAEIDWLIDGPNPDRYLEFTPEVDAFWATHRDWAVREYAEQHPGYRPTPWWEHDAPEPRRRSGDRVESQPAYLRRLGLLLPGELERIEDFEEKELKR